MTPADMLSVSTVKVGLRLTVPGSKATACEGGYASPTRLEMRPETGQELSLGKAMFRDYKEDGILWPQLTVKLTVL
jgi:hypothetical protein